MTDRFDVGEEIAEHVWNVTNRTGQCSRSLVGFYTWNNTTKTESLKIVIQSLQEAIVSAVKAMAHLEHLEDEGK